MDRVLDRLWIGSAEDLDTGTPFRSLGFSGVVDLRDGVEGRKLDVPVHKITNRDGDGWNAEQVDAALAFVAEKIREGRVLIACAGGISRSVSLAVGFLVREQGWDPPTAFAAVKAARPWVAPFATMMDAALGPVAAPALEDAPRRKRLKAG